MLREMVEAALGPLSEEEFKEVLSMATQDIKFNKIRFGKLNKLEDTAVTAVLCGMCGRRC